jgi:hypothetical protein
MFLKKRTEVNEYRNYVLIRRIYGWVLILVLIVGLCPVILNAQSTENWWLKSSLADSVKNLQFHASAKYSYTRMKGIISGSMNTSNLVLVLRKGVFTHFSKYGIDKMDLNLRSSINLNYATKSEFFTDYVDVDLSKSTFAEGGYIWERDDVLLLRNRNTFYGGLGLNISSIKKTTIKSLFASGRVNQQYTIPVENLDVSKKPYAAFYTVHDFGYQVTPGTLFSGKIYYFKNLNHTDRYRYGWLLNLSVSLLKHVKLVTGYHFKYDSESKLLGLIPENSVQNIGIEISL